MSEVNKEPVPQTTPDKSNLTDKLAGWKTSEFWLTALTVVVSLIYLFKGKADQIDTAAPVIQQLAETIPIVIANVAVIFKYIKSRENIKKTTIEQEVKLQINNTNNATEGNKGEVTTTKNI